MTVEKFSEPLPETDTLHVSLFGQEEPQEYLSEVSFSSGDQVKDYLRAIGKYPLLNAEKEVVLSKRIEAGLYAGHVLEQTMLEGTTPPEYQQYELEWLAEDGVQAQDEFFHSNLRLVVSIAKRYQGMGMDFMEIIQEGNLGLRHAVEMFDFAKGYKFSTYATWWVKQSIHRALANQGRTIRVPIHMSEVVHKLSKMKAKLTDELERDPTVDELADAMKLDSGKIVTLLGYMKMQPTSLDASLNDGGGVGKGQKDANFYSLIADTAQTIEEIYENKDRNEQLSILLGIVLSEREERIICMRYGIGCEHPMTLDDIGKMEGVTRERIRQIERRAIGKLRRNGSFRGLEEYL